MKRRVLEAFVVITLACVAACGGKVVIDEGEQGEGGAGSVGPGPSVSSSSSSATGSGFTCPWPDPIGDVQFCGGSAAAGGGECAEIYCDVNNNQFESLCEGSVCQCRYNLVTMCTCAHDQGGNICGGSVEPCCPIPGQ